MASNSNTVQRAAECLRRAERVVVFTGAGASAESGIPTFRDDGGFWREFPPERLATWSGILATVRRDPRALVRFTLSLIEPIARAGPNPGHQAIADLERHVPVTVVTQNIDGLHQAAGSTVVHEIHGSIFEVVTRAGRFVRLLSRHDLRRIAERLGAAVGGRLPLARLLLAVRPLFGVGARGIHRPSLVLFGEALSEPAWTAAQDAARVCDCLLSVGTSGAVYPAAGLPGLARSAGATIITIDPEPATGDIHLRGAAGTVLPELFGKAYP